MTELQIIFQQCWDRLSLASQTPGSAWRTPVLATTPIVGHGSELLCCGWWTLMKCFCGFIRMFVRPRFSS